LAEKKRKQKMMERFIIYGGSIAIVAILMGMTVVILLAKQGRI
jgi:hypothetical protein